MAKETSSRLTPEQWADLWTYVRNGGSARQAAAWALQNFGVMISHTSIIQRAEWREIREELEAEQMASARAAIAMNRGEVVEVVTLTIQDLRREQASLRKELINTPKDEQRPILNRLNEVEDRLKEYVSAFNKQDQLTAQRTYRDDKAAELNSKEVQTAIDSILAELEVRVGAETLADKLLDA